MNESESSLILTLTPAIFGLLGVLVGGGIHFVGMCFDRKWKKEQNLADRYEEYLHCLNGSLLWFQRVGGASTSSEMNDEPHSSDARKMVTLSILYFPELKEKSTEFLNLLISYRFLLIDYFDESHAGNSSTQAVKKGAGKFEKMGDEVIRIRSEIDKLVDKYSRKYAKV
jgi:hypothetical protein